MKKKKYSTLSKKSKNRKETSSGDIVIDPAVAKILAAGVIAVPSTTPEAKKKVKAKDKVHYVNSREFEEEIRAYYTTGNVSQKLGESLMKIAHGLSYAPNFINYSYKDDMIGDAIVKMFSAIRNQKFRLDSGFSPFSYFTTIAFHAFINRIKKENKHHAVLNEYREKVYTELMLDTKETGGAHIYVEPTDDSDNYNTSE
jgi:hypothetical protein